MSLSGYEQLPLASQRRLDDECARFERSWSSPSPDRLAELLATAPPDEVNVWLTELLHIEVERAQRVGLPTSAEDYRKRLSTFAAVVDAVFAEYPPAIGVGEDVGKYRLKRLIGRGASGIVFEAEDTVIGRRVAVKVLTGPFAATRAVQEARIVGQLQHPNVVTVHDAGTANGVWFIAMELLTGSTADQLKANGPFSPEEATRILADVCRGLGAAHAVGLVHRDIKPANVLLSAPSTTGGRATAKLSDFSLALAAVTLGEIQAPAGTPLYMAPEQFGGRDVGPECDIYSLGTTYFALLTGHPPFRSGSTEDLRTAHETAPIPTAITASGTELTAHSRVIARAMAKSPGARYSSVGKLLSALEALSPQRSHRGRPRQVATVVGTAVLLASLVLAIPGPVEWIAARAKWPERREAASLTNPTWSPLFNGRDLAGWSIRGDGAVAVVMDDEPAIRLGGNSSAAILTENEYENYHLRMEVRLAQSEETHSCKIRYHITQPAREEDQWEEFLLIPEKVGGHGLSAHRTARPLEIRQGRLVPLGNGPAVSSETGLSFAKGRWHRIDLVCWSGLAIHAVNESIVRATKRPATPGDPAVSRGRIELRTDRGSMDVRRIEVRPVAGIPTELHNDQ